MAVHQESSPGASSAGTVAAQEEAVSASTRPQGCSVCVWLTVVP
jgi:hypothetical protein